MTRELRSRIFWLLLWVSAEANPGPLWVKNVWVSVGLGLAALLWVVADGYIARRTR